jgi:XapX domain-containing protein
MKILIAFIVAFCIGAASRWTGVPSLAPQAIVGALLIVAMSTGYVSADRLLKRNPSPSVTVSLSSGTRAEQGANGPIADSSSAPINDQQLEACNWSLLAKEDVKERESNDDGKLVR